MCVFFQLVCHSVFKTLILSFLQGESGFSGLPGRDGEEVSTEGIPETPAVILLDECTQLLAQTSTTQYC